MFRFGRSINIISRMWGALFRRVAKIIVLYQYNDYTIAEHFRKQGAQVGENNRILMRSLGQEPYLIRIGDHCTIANEVKFLVHDGGVWVFTEEYPDLQKFGRIDIRDNCFIGLGSFIMGNVTIGPNSIVGAGAVVTKDVPPNSIVAGNPARIVSSLEDYRKRVTALWEDQKPNGYFWGIEKGTRCSPQQIDGIKNRDRSLLREHLIKHFWGSNKA